MTEEEYILKRIEDLYQTLDNKGARKNLQFFSHLFKSYYPLNKIKLITEMPANKNDFICVFSKRNIILFDDKKSSKEESEQVIFVLKSIIQDEIIMLGDKKINKL